MAEHSYPTPTRNHLSNRNADAAKACAVTSGGRTIATSVAHGIRLHDGTIVYYTIADKAAAAREDLENKQLERAQRKARIAAMMASNTAATDHWAHKA